MFSARVYIKQHKRSKQSNNNKVTAASTKQQGISARRVRHLQCGCDVGVAVRCTAVVVVVVFSRGFRSFALRPPRSDLNSVNQKCYHSGKWHTLPRLLLAIQPRHRERLSLLPNGHRTRRGIYVRGRVDNASRPLAADVILIGVIALTFIVPAFSCDVLGYTHR